MIEEKMRFFLVGIGFGATAFYLFWAAEGARMEDEK